MKTYLVWNPYKVAGVLNIAEENQNFLMILQAQKKLGSTISSKIKALDDDHANEIVKAVLNETNSELVIKRLPETLEIHLFRNADYAGYSYALNDRAVYNCGISISLEQLISEDFILDSLWKVMVTTSWCINDDQGVIQAVLVDPTYPNQVWDFLFHYAKPIKLKDGNGMPKFLGDVKQ